MKPRLNKVIELLEQGKTVFGGALAWTGNIDEAMAFADLDYDFVIFEMEHEGFDMKGLRLSLQFLLDRKKIAAKGSLQPDTMPFVRIPPNAREMNQWIIKQALDTGVYGIITPHVDTVEQAMAAVSACRYAQAAGSKDMEPIGQRGYWYRLAPRYWGLTMDEYYEAADLWPLDPDGEMFYMPLIEGIEGVRNLDSILANVKGISAIWAGSADLSVEMGLKGNASNTAVEDQVQNIVSTCKKHNVPCAIFAGPDDVEKRIEQGFRIIISGPSRVDRAFEIGKKITGR